MALPSSGEYINILPQHLCNNLAIKIHRLNIFRFGKSPFLSIDSPGTVLQTTAYGKFHLWELTPPLRLLGFLTRTVAI
jgi:hypothetical protein